MNRSVVVLGATGSIGTQSLEVIDNLDLDVVALAARRPSREFAAQAGRYPDAAIVVVGGSTDERDEFESLVGRSVLFDG